MDAFTTAEADNRDSNGALQSAISGNAAVMAALETDTDARELVTFDDDLYIDYRARRPTLEIRNGVSTRLVWSSPRLLYGRDLNGRDMFYDGSGTTNCFSGNVTRSPNVPADNSVFAPCPGPAANTPDSDALQEGLSWVLSVNKDDPATFEQFWLRHPHAAQKGIKPLERYRR